MSGDRISHAHDMDSKIRIGLHLCGGLPLLVQHGPDAHNHAHMTVLF